MELKRPKLINLQNVKSVNSPHPARLELSVPKKRERFFSVSECSDDYLYVRPRKSKHTKENSMNNFLQSINVRQIHLSAALEEFKF